MSKEPKGKNTFQVITENRQARHHFFIHQTFEAGIELKGCEVKSLREGSVQLKEGYAHVVNHQLFLEGVYISPYIFARTDEIDPQRSRRLLVHKKEISQILSEIQLKRFTLVPLKLYFKNGMAKIELGLAKGKKIYDKREAIKKRETERMIDRAKKQKGYHAKT